MMKNMRRLFLVMTGMMSFILPAFGSENNSNEVVIFAVFRPYSTVLYPAQTYNYKKIGINVADNSRYLQWPS